MKMSRLKICVRLVHNYNRSVYSISANIHSHFIANVNNARFYKKSSKIRESTCCVNYEKKMSTNLTENYSTIARTFVNTNKINGVSIYGNQGCYRLFNQRSLVHTGEKKNVKHFSDAANTKINAATTVQLDGIWKVLSESTAVEFCQNGFVTLHNVSGLPWWATIILATWGIRAVVTLPLALYQNYTLAKLENLKVEMDGIVKELKMETNFAVAKYKWTENYARAMYKRAKITKNKDIKLQNLKQIHLIRKLSKFMLIALKKQWQKLIERENCHPMKSAIVFIVQIPMWIVLSTSLRNLCYMLPYSTERAYAIYLEITTGGFGCITNLAVADDTFALPITLGLLNLTVIEIHNLMRTTEPTKIQKYLLYFFRFVAVGMIPLASFVPAGMSLYWTSSSAFGIVQNLILVSPRVRRLARIPPTERELEEPYKYLYKNLCRKIGLKNVSLPNTVEKS